MQVRQKAEHWKATEKWDKQIIISRQERTEAYLALAGQLTVSEEKDWLDALKKLDLVQWFRNAFRYTHWFTQKAGPMQKGQNALYCSRKQSIWHCWKVEPDDLHWVD